MGHWLRTSCLIITLLTATQQAESAGESAPKDPKTALHVTVYSDGLGMISDHRTVVLTDDRSELAFEGISREIIPASALLTADGNLSVLALDYDFDLLTPEAMLRRAVGQEVGVVRTHPTTGEETVEQATVLSAESGVVLRYRDRIETGIPGRLVFDKLPADLHSVPTLVATVDSGAGGGGARYIDVNLSYLTNGLTWNADYVAEVNDTIDLIDVFGRATLTNTTGTDFNDASLTLVAGDIRRVQPPVVARAKAMMMDRGGVAAEAMAAAPMPEREELADLHAYRLPNLVSIDDRESKQLALLAATGLTLVREFVSENQAAVYHPQHGESRPQHATVVLSFDNASGKGQAPLPAGTIRVYSRDTHGVRRLLGEDRVPHTPVGGSVKITPGRAFDVTVKRTQTDFVRAGLPRDVFESAHRIDIRNAKNEAVTVKVVERMTSDWQILEESAPHEKEAADSAVWRVPVGAGSTAEITYRVRIQ